MFMVPMEFQSISLCHFYVHFHLSSIVEINEMVPQIAISDDNTIKTKSLKLNL